MPAEAIKIIELIREDSALINLEIADAIIQLAAQQTKGLRIKSQMLNFTAVILQTTAILTILL